MRRILQTNDKTGYFKPFRRIFQTNVKTGYFQPMRRQDISDQ